jgi:hypothetical protein
VAPIAEALVNLIDKKGDVEADGLDGDLDMELQDEPGRGRGRTTTRGSQVSFALCTERRWVLLWESKGQDEPKTRRYGISIHFIFPGEYDLGIDGPGDPSGDGGRSGGYLISDAASSILRNSGTGFEGIGSGMGTGVSEEDLDSTLKWKSIVERCNTHGGNGDRVGIVLEKNGDLVLPCPSLSSSSLGEGERQVDGEEGRGTRVGSVLNELFEELDGLCR